MSVKWKHHVFRNSLIPWYDKTPVCWFLVAVMLGIFLFALAGISSALEKAPDCLWVPLVLCILSLFLMVKIVLRIRRRAEWFSRE